MTATQPDLENSIQLALEAASAANDTAEDVARLSSDTAAAADRLDQFAKTMKPAMIGVVAGSVLAMALSGLIYVRTLSDMRTATATQMEALTLFTETVSDLKQEIAALEDLHTAVQALSTAQQEGIDRIETTLTEGMAQAQSVKQDESAESPSGTTPQMLRSVVETTRAEHIDTREAFAAGLSDLQLALTRMLADRPVPAQGTQRSAAPAAPQKKPVRPRPVRVAPNPFSYP